MYLLILLLPLLGALFSGFAGRWFGHYGSSLISINCIFVSLFFSILVFFEIGFSNTVIYILIKS